MVRRRSRENDETRRTSEISKEGSAPTRPFSPSPWRLINHGRSVVDVKVCTNKHVRINRDIMTSARAFVASTVHRYRAITHITATGQQTGLEASPVRGKNSFVLLSSIPQRRSRGRSGTWRVLKSRYIGLEIIHDVCNGATNGSNIVSRERLFNGGKR